jgi:hypothetical protein
VKRPLIVREKKNMSKNLGYLFPKKGWGQVFREHQRTLEADVQAFRDDPSKLSIDFLTYVGEHLQEVYKSLSESAKLSAINFSIRYPLTLETEQAYKDIRALIELIEISSTVSHSAQAQRVYEAYLSLEKRLESVERYLYQITQVL